MIKGTEFLLLISSLTCICLISVLQPCSGEIGYDPLSNFLHTQRLRGSVTGKKDAEEGYLAGDHTYSQEGLKEANKITALIGQPDGVYFDQYSGYVTVDEKAGRALFYYFVESQNSSTKPLLLWLNGGPGCSSLGDGAFTELGPFRVNRDGKSLWHNEYSWNNVANILFLESPAGVGFSYSNTTSDYVTGDGKTARDSYTFLINWLERFPEYKTRDFFIAGESYAGHYVPQLAEFILNQNNLPNQTVTINLKGIAIGNAYVDMETHLKGIYDFLWSHSIISDDVYEAVVSNCNFSAEARDSDECILSLENAFHQRSSIYPYHIYEPWCFSNKIVPSMSGFDPCSSDYVNSYLNKPEVQKKLHANISGELPGPWALCNFNVNSNWTDKPATVLPTIKNVMASGVSVWIFSGDTDSRVPVTTSRYAIKKIGAPVTTPWYPWFTQGEVGGFAEAYENLTFVSIRGAGHFVPSYEPARSLVFFSSFLEEKLPPSE